MSGRLYGLRPVDFTAARTKEAAAAKAAGHAALAREITKLRRPTVSAWAVNRLAREHPDELAELLSIGRELREAWQAQDAGALAGLSRRRGEVTGRLARLVRAGGGLSAAAVAPHAHGHDPAHHDHSHHGHAHDHGHDHAGAHHGHEHRHADDDVCATCGHSHAPDPALLSGDRFDWRTAWSAVAAVGIRPCSGALIVLTFAFLNGLWLGGVVSVAAMALGTAITVSVLATLAVTAKNWAVALAGDGRAGNRVHAAIEIGGAAMVFLLGLTLLMASLGA